MKNIFVLALLSFVIIGLNAQTKNVPSVDMKDLSGKIINSSEFDNEGKPFIINFWATWCSPCKRELDNISEIYAEWQAETGVKMYAISIDDARRSKQVKPHVDASGWDFEVLLDENSDFRRAMNVNNPPYTFLIDGNGKIVYQHVGYSEGDEDELYEQILALTK